MKIALIDTDYMESMEATYRKTPNLKSKSYDEQSRTFASEVFGIKHHYAKNLSEMGHEIIAITPNNEIMQKQWARENNVSYSSGLFQNTPVLKKWFKPNWLEKILIAQIKKYAPDVVYSLVIELKNNRLMWNIKKECKLLAVQISAKLPNPKYFAPYDLMVTSLPHFTDYFRKCGKNSELLKLGFESTILKKLQKNKCQYKVTHIGGYGPIHNDRNIVLEKVADKIKMDTWGYATENLDKESSILKNYHGGVWGLDMFNVLYNSKMTITGHIKKVARNYANNMTLYEATGCGCLLVTDMKDNLGEIFEIGKEVVAYKDADDLVEKIKYYLEHEDERAKIAKAGQERTLKDHSYKKRSEELISILEKYL